MKTDRRCRRIAAQIDALEPEARRAFRCYVALLALQHRAPNDARADYIARIQAIFEAGYLPDLPELQTLH